MTTQTKIYSPTTIKPMRLEVCCFCYIDKLLFRILKLLLWLIFILVWFKFKGLRDPEHRRGSEMDLFCPMLPFLFYFMFRL